MKNFFLYIKNFLLYISQVSFLSFKYRARPVTGITKRQSDYEIAILTVTSKVNNDYDAIYAVKKFMLKYDKNALSNDTKLLQEILISNRPTLDLLKILKQT